MPQKHKMEVCITQKTEGLSCEIAGGHQEVTHHFEISLFSILVSFMFCTDCPDSSMISQQSRHFLNALVI